MTIRSPLRTARHLFAAVRESPELLALGCLWAVVLFVIIAIVLFPYLVALAAIAIGAHGVGWL